jgi:branched-chain amino acid transport system ATP-binding protein
VTPVLQCIGVQKRFGNLLASRSIDLSIGPGEIVGIIGANGAGKTTLLNLISGYLRPSAGTILFQGLDITGVAPRLLAKRGIARSFQVPQLFTRFTLLQNVMMALMLLVEPQSSIMGKFESEHLAAAARAILESYGLSGSEGMIASQVPQGVRKLLDIAMATCAKPVLVLLDEPTSGVSSEEKHGLMRQLAARFAKASMTVVFIEHDMDVVREYASRVVALYDGEVIADGDAGTVFSESRVIDLIVGHSTPAAGRLHRA